MQLVQQPDDFVVNTGTNVGTIAATGETPMNLPKNGYPPLGWTAPGDPMADTIFFIRPASPTNPANFTPLFPNLGSDNTIRAGDYIEIYGGGPVHQIVAVNSPAKASIPFDCVTVFDANATANPKTSPTVVSGGLFNSRAPNYRIIRQPRLLNGEAPIPLPNNIGLDFSVVYFGPTQVALTNLQPQQIPPPPAWLPANEWPAAQPLYCDILFTPSGAVTGQGTQTGQIYLWVRDLSADNSTNILNGFPVIVAVQMGTGFISSQQPGNPNNPFDITEDGRGTGS